MARIELVLAEADVVIVLTNPDAGGMEVHPLWECERTPVQLRTLAAQLALDFAERRGGGFVEIEIIDSREAD